MRFINCRGMKLCRRHPTEMTVVYCLLWLLLLAMVSVSYSATFTKLTLLTGSVPCAADPPSSVISLPEAVSMLAVVGAVDCVAPFALCAWVCEADSRCTSFNYNGTGQRCELYSSAPINFTVTTSCEYFQDQSLNRSCPMLYGATGKTTMAPDFCCSFPFSNNGIIYNSCASNSSDSNNKGCYMARRIWIYCLPPADTTVNLANDTLIVPGISQPVPTISIGGWIIIQKNLIDGSLVFQQNWTAYKNGFGDPMADHFWFGNDKLNSLTSSAKWKLRVEVQANTTGKWYSAEYEVFSVGKEANGYSLRLSGYYGDAGDSLTTASNAGWISNGEKFTTMDVDYDRAPSNCATSSSNGGGWWYNYCSMSALNTVYPKYSYWEPLKTQKLSSTLDVSSSRMMIKSAS